MFDRIKGTPWEPNPGRSGDYNIKPRTHLPDTGPVSVPARGRNDAEAEYNINRRFKIYKSDLINYGIQHGCLGCNMMREGKSTQRHNESCRKRIEQQLREDKDKTVHEQEQGDRVQKASDKIPSQE